MRKLVILTALLFGACHHAAPPNVGAAMDESTPAGPERCTQMVDHMLGIMEAKLSFTERMMARSFKSQVVDACRKEGLSQAQADCFLRVKTPEDLQRVDECPALKAHPPRVAERGTA